MTKLARNFCNVFQVVTVIFLLFFAVAGNANVIFPCAKTITECGCTITEPGIYTVMADLSSAQGLTNKNGCIDIDACQVLLLTNGFNIFGDGTGIGIHVQTNASEVFLEGVGADFFSQTTISGWYYAIESQANNVIVDSIALEGNTVGMFLKGASNNNITDFEATNNILYGVWLTDCSRNNQISSFGISGNGFGGVYVGCSAVGPDGPACQYREQRSSDNYIYNVVSESNGSGIALELGSTRNIVANTTTQSNIIFDLFDGNAECDANTWEVNTFNTANQNCIQ